MKKFYTFLLIALAMLLPTAVSADSVSQDEALAKAVQFFSKGAQTRSVAQFELIWNGEAAETRTTAEPAFFIFNRTDAPGFVIIAGDDSVSPVIGYSFENGFGKGEMPSNLRFWLEGVRDMILQARAAGLPAVDQTPMLGEVVKQLKTANWDQGRPYNAECPTYGGQSTVTGCVATAAAIVCKYHRWPEQGNGTTAAYKTRTRGISVPARTLGSYNYDLMLDNYTSGYNEAQGAEVARLMADIGAGVKADYQVSATGAFTTDQLRCMVDHMRYNKSARLAIRDGYTDEEWKRLLKAEIEADRPVLYSGNSDAGGHAFVLDGYTSDGMFCFNWGWSGAANGAYSLNSMNAGGYNFTYGHEVILDLWPDKEGTSTTYADYLVVGAQTGYAGLYSPTKIFTTGTVFQAEVLCYNLSAQGYNGKVVLALADKNYQVKEHLVAEQSMSVRSAGGGYVYAGHAQFRDAKITSAIKPGDRIIVLYWDRATQGWLRMRKYTEDAIDEIIVMEANPDGNAIASGTQLNWNRAQKQLTIRSYAGATFELLKGSSKIASQEVTAEPIVLKDMATGTYTVRIYFDADEPCEFTLKL